jgi:hypothetical protein
VPIDVVLGDGRLSLAKRPNATIDWLLLDAYSSDSLPVHLMTREALHMYMGKLTPGGVLSFHISNRYLDLEPVLGNLAADAGLACLSRNDNEFSKAEKETGLKSRSHWVVMARRRSDLGLLTQDERWRPARKVYSLGVWTDDYSSVFSVFSTR